MASISIVKIKVRRGTDAERKLVRFDLGELVFTTDALSKRLFVGDGSVYGGKPVASKYYQGSTSSLTDLQYAQIGDIILNTDDSRLYALTGSSGGFPDFSNPSAYQLIIIPGSIYIQDLNLTTVPSGSGSVSSGQLYLNGANQLVIKP